MTKALVVETEAEAAGVETEAEAEAVASETEAEAAGFETEAEARGSYLILLAVPYNHLQLDLSVIYSGLGAVSLIRQQQQQKRTN